MKKFILASVVLVAFSMSIIFFEISCSKDSSAQTSSSDYLLYYKDINSAYELWIANSEGTNKRQITPILPTGWKMNGGSSGISLSSDKTKVFFTAYNTSSSLDAIYKCNIDGSNVVKVIDEGASHQGYNVIIVK